jgi:hypothetical protein
MSNSMSSPLIAIAHVEFDVLTPDPSPKGEGALTTIHSSSGEGALPTIHGSSGEGALSTIHGSSEGCLSYARAAYSSESSRASRDASMMLLEHPTVAHRFDPLPDSTSTRVVAAVPAAPSRIRTL